MGIFDLFKKKEKQPSSPAEEDLKSAQEEFKKGDYTESLGALARGFNKDVEYKPLYELAVKCLEQFGATEEQQLFAAGIKDMQSFAAFHALGTHFFQVDNIQLARPFLEKAVALDSSNRMCNHDLALVYARRFQIDKAIETMELNPPNEDFWDYWFWNKLMLLANRPEGIDENLQALLRSLDDEADQEAIAIPRQKVNESREIAARLVHFPKPEINIRDWHFLQYGGAILDFFEEPDQYVAGGRYVALWGSHANIKEICLRLKSFLPTVEVDVEGIRYMPNRSAKIIGLVLGELLDLPAHEFVPGQSTENCLIVGAEADDFNGHPELANAQNGQILFAFNHHWLGPAHISPDISGLMSQMYTFPWDGGNMRIANTETGETEKTPPDERPEVQIVADILSEEPELEDYSEHLAFYHAHRKFLKAVRSKTDARRYNFMVESPVPGSYFGS